MSRPRHPEWKEPLDRLLEAQVVESLSEEQEKELAGLLQRHPEAREYYLNARFVDAALGEGIGLTDTRDDLPVPTPPRVAAPSSTGRRTRIALVAAAGLLALVGILAVLLGPGRESDVVAKVGDAREVAWNGKPLSPGARLEKGPVEIAGGELGLRMATGAKVTLVGRTRLEMIDPGAVRLDRGEVRVHVPAAAGNITVLLDELRIIDLGTRFEVHRMEDGLRTIRTREGTVLVTDLPAGKDDQGLALTALQTLWMAADAPAGSVHTFPAASAPVDLVAGSAPRIDDPRWNQGSRTALFLMGRNLTLGGDVTVDVVQGAWTSTSRKTLSKGTRVDAFLFRAYPNPKGGKSSNRITFTFDRPIVGVDAGGSTSVTRALGLTPPPGLAPFDPGKDAIEIGTDRRSVTLTSDRWRSHDDCRILVEARP